MSKINTIILILVIVVILGAGYVFYRWNYNQTPVYGVPSNTGDTGKTLIPISRPPTQTQNQASQTPSRLQYVVTYTASGYSPATLEVPKGAIVTFKNQSNEPMWTASAIHPTHRAYPTTGGCLGSTFDECAGANPGETWSFKFGFLGTWGYHNHLNASHLGTIVVK